jgi:L-amino acid N-acyltransferase YncA
MRWQVRIASGSDIRAITTIYNHAIAAGLQTGHLAPVDTAERTLWLREHSAHKHPIFVAENAASEVVGYCSISAYREGREAFRHTAEISFFVHADNQRSGIGSALVRHAISQCRALNINSLVAILLDANEPSVDFLKTHGFAKWGYLPAVADIEGREVGHLYYGRRV